MRKGEPADLGDEEAVAALREKERRRHERDIGDLRKVMASVEGRRLLWRYMARLGVFSSSFTANANETAYNEGRRAGGLMIFVECDEHCAEAFLSAQREARRDQLG